LPTSSHQRVHIWQKKDDFHIVFDKEYPEKQMQKDLEQIAQICESQNNDYE